MAIQFDNGEKWLVEVRGSGWVKDCTEGKSWEDDELGRSDFFRCQKRYIYI